MSNDYLKQYPSSHTYEEIIRNSNSKTNIAYCYMGDKEQSIIISDRLGNLKLLFVSNKENYSKELNLNNNHELWSFIEKMEDNIFREMAIDTLFNVYCEYYNYLDSSNIDLFEKIN